MKRLKFLFVGLAIMAAIGTAFATRPCVDCVLADQYYYSGGTYIYAGTYGYDYSCFNFAGVCTYYQPNPITQPNYYAPCRLGVFAPVQ